MTLLAELEQRHQEWRPWLGVVAQVLGELGARDWDAGVPPLPSARDPAAPLLAGATARVDRHAVARAFAKLLPKHRANPAMVLQAALNADEARLGALAGDMDPDAFRARAALLPMPLLHACSRRYAEAIAQDWTKGYCPVCGRWPAFAETCGVERTRHLRCAGCGSAWRMHVLSCAYCGLVDHERLACLVPHGGAPNSAVEVCNRCLGFLKVFTRLRPCPSVDVLVEDLASVELDIAALERGYKRPEERACPLGLEILAA